MGTPVEMTKAQILITIGIICNQDTVLKRGRQPNASPAVVAFVGALIRTSVDSSIIIHLAFLP